MQILVFCGDPGVPLFGPSGASAHLRGVVGGLVALGHEVKVAAVTAADHRGRVGDRLCVPWVTVGKRSWPRGLRAWGERADGWRLARRARALGPIDLLWERSSLRCDAGVWLAKKLGAHHLVELNAPLRMERGVRGNQEWVLRRADSVVAVSRWLERWACGLGVRSVRHVPNGSDLLPVAAPVDPVWFHHGSLRPWHGVHHLVPMLERAPRAQLWVVGDGELRAHPQIYRVPSQTGPALHQLMHAAGVGLLPYGPEAAPWYDPLKLGDYRAAGIPTVGSLHRSARGCDRQVDLRDVAGWLRAIEEVQQQPRQIQARPWSDVCAEALKDVTGCA